MCGAVPCKLALGFRAWESCEKTKEGERPRASGKRALFTLLERIWASVCLKEMPLGKQRLAHCVCWGMSDGYRP